MKKQQPKKILIGLSLFVIISIALFAFQDSSKIKQPDRTAIIDTLPKNKDIDIKIKMADIDKIIKESMEIANKSLQAIDWNKISKEVAQSLDKIDFNKIKMEIDRSIKSIDWDKMKMEIDRSIKEIDMEKIHNDIEKEMKINSREIKKEMKKVKKEMEINKDKIKMEMEKEKEEIKKTKGEITI